MEIRLGGFGGQGIITSGYIIGHAASIYDKKSSTLTREYGPEKRGARVAADVVISSEEIDYPKVIKPDLLILVAQEAYDYYSHNIKDQGTILLDQDLVKEDMDKHPHAKVYKIQANKMAEELGKRIVANIVMIGFFTAVTSIINRDSMKKAVFDIVPEKARELNEKAFNLGYRRGEEIKE